MKLKTKQMMLKTKQMMLKSKQKILPKKAKTEKNFYTKSVKTNAETRLPVCSIVIDGNTVGAFSEKSNFTNITTIYRKSNQLQ